MESPVPELCNNSSRDVTDSSFRSRFLLGLADSGRHDRRDIMVTQRFICICQNNLAVLRAWMLCNAGFKIVADCSDRNTVKVLVHMDMTPEPGVHLHIESRLNECIPAV